MRIAAWIVGTLLLGLAAVSTYRHDDAGTAHALGAAAGSILGSVGICAIVALVAVQVRKRGRVWSPWMFLAAGLLAIAVAESKAMRDGAQAGGYAPPAAALAASSSGTRAAR